MDKTAFFCGHIIQDNFLNAKFDCLKSTVDLAANTFYNSLVSGLRQNNICTYQMSILPNDKELLSDAKGCLINTFIFKRKRNRFMQFMANVFQSMSAVLKYKKATKNTDRFVVFDSLRVTSNVGGLLMCKMFRIRTMGIVTDVPGYRIKTNESNSFKKRFIDWINKCIIQKFDCYTFLSKQMSDIPLFSKKKKTAIVEGFYEETVPFISQNTYSYPPFKIVYAGSLFRQYGVLNLIEAFEHLNDKDIELYIYGDGEAKEEIIKKTTINPKIHYCSPVSHIEIVKIERSCHLLVNPRPIDDEYVKYSFPSKNIEYMASGIPVLFTKIPSLPQEYMPYVNLIEDNNASTLSTAIKDILSINSYDSYVKKANLARQFIIKNKTAREQTKKIIEIAFSK